MFPAPPGIESSPEQLPLNHDHASNRGTNSILTPVSWGVLKDLIEGRLDSSQARLVYKLVGRSDDWRAKLQELLEEADSVPLTRP